MSMEEKVPYSDEILERTLGQGKSMTMNERQELREAYNWEQEEKEKSGNKLANSVKDFKDNTINPLDLPRHRVYHTCSRFQECPIDYKCRSYDSSYMACRSCVLTDTDDVCKKPDIHNDKTFNMLIKRERIDLDGDKDVEVY